MKALHHEITRRGAMKAPYYTMMEYERQTGYTVAGPLSAQPRALRLRIARQLQDWYIYSGNKQRAGDAASLMRP